MATTEQDTRGGTSVWAIDPAHTLVQFSAKHMMITTVKGGFSEVTGSIVASEDSPDRSTVEVEIGAASIDTRVGQRDDHLRSADFLEVERFPKITFRSRRVEGAHARPGDEFKLVGDLTIKDTTMEVVLDCVFEGRGKDPWGKERAGFAVEGEIDRRDWGLKWNQAIETGGVLVANKVRIEAEVQFVRQDG